MMYMYGLLRTPNFLDVLVNCLMNIYLYTTYVSTIDSIPPLDRSLKVRLLPYLSLIIVTVIVSDNAYLGL